MSVFQVWSEQRTTGKHQQKIDVSQLPVGVYLMKIQMGDSGFLTRRLVIGN
ncbi:MAG: T9SS type A sorting domain-containing protein [Bacteroidales bacterium]